MRGVLLVAAAAAAENGSAWRERLGLQGGACPAECPLRHRSIVNIKDFGRAGFADRQFIIEGVTIMAVSLCARVVLPMPEESFGGHDMSAAGAVAVVLDVNAAAPAANIITAATTLAIARLLLFGGETASGKEP